MIHSKKRWNIREDSILETGLQSGLKLAELQTQLPRRSDHAIVRRAQNKGFGIRTEQNGEKIFIDELKTRNRRKDEAPSVQTAASYPEEYNECITSTIVAKKPAIANGTSITLLALKILNDNLLSVTPETVKKISEIIIESNGDNHAA